MQVGLRHFRAERHSFTLVEAMLATIIVSIGFVSIIKLCTTCTQTYSSTSQYVIAAQLANNIREIVYKTPGYTDIDSTTSPNAIAGKSFNPPISHCLYSKTIGTQAVGGSDWVTLPDARYSWLPDLSKYTQTIAVDKVTTADLRVISATETGMKRVTVTITYKSTPTATPVQVHKMYFLLFSLK